MVELRTEEYRRFSKQLLGLVLLFMAIDPMSKAA